jgi:LCP family protein required for cell wall assembly
VAGKDKPYKVYRGGRTRGPAKPIKSREDGSFADGDAKQPKQKTKRGGWGSWRRWRRIIFSVIAIFLLIVIVWAVLGYLAVNRGVKEANARLDKAAYAALTPDSGSLLSNPSNILILGADVGANRKDRSGRGRSDSIMLLRTNPDDHRLSFVSIPRDLRVDIPGRGPDKINAAYAYGGTALAIETVEALTGLPVNHVIVVDFSTFNEVVDAIGGITIVNPKPILSNPFDCPLKPDQCATWEGWRFKKGEIHLDGRRALVYARIRENQLDSSESDITRGERQQRVVQAIMDKITGLSGFLRMPFIGDDVITPLATDLSTNELLQVMWVRKRAADDKTLRCRLGGDPETIDGASVIVSSEDNASVILQITGQSAPQRPPKGRPYAPGCFVGRAGG